MHYFDEIVRVVVLADKIISQGYLKFVKNLTAQEDFMKIGLRLDLTVL